MPYYDFHCNHCSETHMDQFVNHMDDKEVIVCAMCEGSVTMLPPISAKYYEFHEGLYPELMGYDNKKPITSKAELLRESEKRGKYSEYAYG